MKISQILDKIDERQLFVPAFQREYVWKRPDAKNLISRVIKVCTQTVDIVAGLPKVEFETKTINT